MNFDWTSRRILIVDRDENFRFFTRGLFKHHRVREVISVARATDVPRVLAQHEIHVAFVELTHAETGVVHLLNWLRHGKDSPARDLPVVLLARTLDKTQLARACAFGIHGILQKPLSGEKMLRAVIGVTTNPRIVTPAFGPDPGHSPNAAAETVSPDHRPPQRPRPNVASVKSAGRRPPTAAGRVEPAARLTGVGIETVPLPEKRDGGAIELAEPARPPKAAIERPERVPPPAPASEAAGDAIAPDSPKAPAAKRGRGKHVADAVAPVEPTHSEAANAPSLEDIFEAHVRWVESNGRDGQRANLEGRALGGRRLTAAVLTSARFRRADLSGGDFTGAQMQGIDLRHADVLAGTFVGADLSLARLRHTILRGGKFSGASLKGADLGGADLREADLGDADLTGAVLLGARLDGADLSRVSGLTQGQLDRVRGDARTRLPPGLVLPPPPGLSSADPFTI